MTGPNTDAFGGPDSPLPPLGPLDSGGYPDPFGGDRPGKVGGAASSLLADFAAYFGSRGVRIGAAVVVAGGAGVGLAFAVGGGGGNNAPAPPQGAPPAAPAALPPSTAAAAPSTPPPAPVPAPTSSTSTTLPRSATRPNVQGIQALFNQSAYSTYYTVEATPGAPNQTLTYRWSLLMQADPGCASGFAGNTPTANQATWFHADKHPQGDEPTGPCDHTQQVGTGHPGQVTVLVISSDGWQCTATDTGTVTHFSEGASCSLGF